jgi:RNA polymerase primary sigma factor
MYADDPVQDYLREVSKGPLSREDEAECVRHIRAQDDQAELAEKDLLEANLAMVVKVARNHPSERIHILDLIITGNYALMTALHAFAASDSGNFSAFAFAVRRKRHHPRRCHFRVAGPRYDVPGQPKAKSQ